MRLRGGDNSTTPPGASYGTGAEPSRLVQRLLRQRRELMQQLAAVDAEIEQALGGASTTNQSKAEACRT